MNRFCEACGAPNPIDAAACLSCGTTQPDAIDPTAVATSTTGRQTGVSGQQPRSATGGYGTPAPSATPPSFGRHAPVDAYTREPRAATEYVTGPTTTTLPPAAAASGPPASGRSNRGLIIGGIVAAVVVIVGLLTAVIVLAARPNPKQAAIINTDATTTVAADPTTTTPVMTTTVGPETAAPTITPTTSFHEPQTYASTLPANVASAADIPIGTWAVFLGTYRTESEAASHLAGMTGEASAAQILHSTDVPNLSDGWWIIYLGGYDTSDDAIDQCYSMSLTDRDDCYASYLSTDPADNKLRVYPDGGD